MLFIYWFVFFSLKDLSMQFLEKAMAPHSSTLAWKIPWTEEPGRLQSMGLQRVVHDGASEQPPPVILHSETLGNFTTLIFLIYFLYLFIIQMATHSSILAWRIPGTAEPGELPSMGSHRVGHD